MRLSVAMAAYNGEEYIEEQIDSIVSQMRAEDELIISINPSFDATEAIVTSYAEKDSRIVADRHSPPLVDISEVADIGDAFRRIPVGAHKPEAVSHISAHRGPPGASAFCIHG